MVTDTIKRIIFSVITTIVLVHFSYVIGHRDGLHSLVEEVKGYADTLCIRDTIVQYEPVLEERIVLRKELIPVHDTLRLRDTLYVYLEREQVVWQDSLSKVYASGIMPQIDSVEHYVTERVVYETKNIFVPSRKRWGLGIQAGYGIGLDKNGMTMHPYVGFGVSYNIINW